MRKLATCSGLAMVAALLSACVTGDPAPAGRVDVRQARLPFGIVEPGQNHDVTAELAMARDGSLSLNGNRIAFAQLGPALEREAARGDTKLSLVVDGDMPFADVLPIMAVIESTAGLRMLPDGFAPYRAFGDPARNGALPGEGQAYRGATDAFELPVWTGMDEASRQCVASLDGLRLAHEALYDRSFTRLDDWVQGAGGVQAFLDDPQFASTRATIQSAPDTPWHCVAGAGFAALLAGYPDIEFRITPQ